MATHPPSISQPYHPSNLHGRHRQESLQRAILLRSIRHGVPYALELGGFSTSGEAIDFAQEESRLPNASGCAVVYVEPPDDVLGTLSCPSPASTQKGILSARREVS